MAVSDVSDAQTSGRTGYPAEWMTPDEMKRISSRSYSKSLVLYFSHVALYFSSLVGILAPWSIWISLPFCLLNGFAIGLLYLIAHEAGHRSFTPNPTLSDWLARFAFIFTAHSRSVWVEAHNITHHRNTNLLGRDGVWEPMTLEQYRNAGPLRRAYERFERSPFGGLTYYYWGILLTRGGLPLRMDTPNKWRRFAGDIAFMVLGVILLIALVGALGTWLDPSRPLWLAIALGWALPFMLGMWIISSSIYLQHTHPDIIWFEDEDEWNYYDTQVRGSTDVILPWVVRKAFPLYQEVMDHTAHHAFMNVPIYNVPEAQACLARTYGDDVITYKLTLARFLNITRKCKLLDMERKCWVDFDGNPTS